MKSILAPIVLFVYNRIKHTRLTVEALQKNHLAKESELFICSDGYKDGLDKQKVLEVRDYIKNIDGFKRVVIIEQSKNKGLANSIIDGVTDIVNRYGKIIVLEDDIVTSPYFLKFMNEALDFYEKKEQIWHISGWNYPIKTDGLQDTFIWRMMNCWGWATWKDRWKYFEKNPKKLIDTYDEYDIYKFDLDDAGLYWVQVVKNFKNEMDTWAIFWYATIFNHKGLCVNPAISYVQNIGFDGSGTNTGIRGDYAISQLNVKKVSFCNDVYENDLALFKIKQFLKNHKNSNLIFSKNLNIIVSKLNSLDRNVMYVVYGAGSGARLILGYFKTNIAYIVDVNKNISKKYLEGIRIYHIDKIKNQPNIKIIVSVFGREIDIVDNLCTCYQIPRSNIITFDLE